MAERSDIKVIIGADTAGLEQGLDKATDSVDKFGKTATMSTRAAVRAITTAATTMTVMFAKAAKDVNDAQAQIGKIAGLSSDGMETLTKSAVNVARTVPQSFDEVGRAVAAVYEKLNLSGQAGEQMATTILNATRLTGGSVEGLSASLSRFQGAMNLENAELPAVLDAVYEASRSTGSSMERLLNILAWNRDAMKEVGLTGKDAVKGLEAMLASGVKVEETFTKTAKEALAAFAENTVTVSQATTEAAGRIGEASGQTEVLSGVISAAAENSLTFSDRIAQLGNYFEGLIAPVADNAGALLGYSSAALAAAGSIGEIVVAYKALVSAGFLANISKLMPFIGKAGAVGLVVGAGALAYNAHTNNPDSTNGSAGKGSARRPNQRKGSRSVGFIPTPKLTTKEAVPDVVEPDDVFGDRDRVRLDYVSSGNIGKKKSGGKKKDSPELPAREEALKRLAEEQAKLNREEQIGIEIESILQERMGHTNESMALASDIANEYSNIWAGLNERARVWTETWDGNATSIADYLGFGEGEREAASEIANAYEEIWASMNAFNKVNEESGSIFEDLGISLSQWQNDLADGFSRAIQNGESLGDVFEALLKDMAALIVKGLLMKYVIAPLGEALGFSQGGALDGGQQVGAYANGAAFVGGRVAPFARGGIVTAPTLFPMASGAGLMGEAGPEAVMPLERIGGKLGVHADISGGDAPNVSINVVNTGTPQQITAQTMQRDPATKQWIIDVVTKDLGSGGPTASTVRKLNR